MCHTVVKDVGTSFGGGLSAICLSRCESAQGYEQGGINGARIEEQSANDFLEAGDAGLVKQGGVIWFWGELGGCAIIWLGPPVW
jgi:hypothetical protein